MSEKYPRASEERAVQYPCAYCGAQPGDWCVKASRSLTEKSPLLHVSRIEQENAAWLLTHRRVVSGGPAALEISGLGGVR